VTRSHTVLAVAAFAVTLVCWIQAAAEESLITDRPDFTESPQVVGPGRLQLEGGATYQESGDEKFTSAGELLVRLGVSRRLELRLETLTYAWIDTPSGNPSGFVDSTIGFKVQLSSPGGAGVLGGADAGIIVSSSFPSGNSEFRTGAWQPKALLALGWDLNQQFSFGTNVGYGRPSDGDDRFDTWFASAVLGIGVADATSVFFELYGFNREEPRGPSTATFQTGVAHTVSPDLQLDARVARRITDDGPDLLIGVGVSWRL
jgi:hypothetical protein